MSRAPLYPAAAAAAKGSRPVDANAGLWFQRFVSLDPSSWTLGQGKVEWIKTLGDTVGDMQLLRLAAMRREKLMKALGGQVLQFETRWNFATGLGLPHPLENGLAWYHTLGVPYLPASGVKGLVRAWLRSWVDGFSVEDELRWFGAVGDSPAVGGLIFFDALPVEPPRIGADVMTPHAGGWYADGEATPGEMFSVPADWISPTPIAFLVVKSATLAFAIAPRTSAESNLVEPAFEALRCALDMVGAGAKTAVGYGRMSPVNAVAATEELGGIEDELARIASDGLRVGHPDVVAWIEELEKGDAGKWASPEARADAATAIKAKMLEKGVWRPDASLPGKGSSLARTQRVIAFLPPDGG